MVRSCLNKKWKRKKWKQPSERVMTRIMIEVLLPQQATIKETKAEYLHLKESVQHILIQKHISNHL